MFKFTDVTASHVYSQASKLHEDTNYLNDDLRRKQMSIGLNVFHTMSALKSTILVYVNNLPYTQDGVVNI